MRGVLERPTGLAYHPAVLSEGQERALLDLCQAMEFEPVVIHGQAAKRTVRHFGVGYQYGSGVLTETDPLPSDLADLRDRCAALAAVPTDRLAEALITRYPPGAGIGWHRDAPAFGPTVVGVSLLSACTMRFQRRVRGERRVFELELEPRSVYVLGGSVRAVWQHSIPPVEDPRYSVTFRSVRSAVG
jgi:alkylated DNA repair dioxygenase AlkB